MRKSFHISALFSLCHLMPYYKNMNHRHFNQVMRLLFTSVAFPRVKAKRQTAAFLWGLFDRHRIHWSLLPLYRPATFTSPITPSYYIAIMLHYGLQSNTMVPTSCQVRAVTVEHTPKYIQTLSATLYHPYLSQTPFISPPDTSFVRHLIWTPGAPGWHR